MQQTNFAAIEKKWQGRWEKEKTFEVDEKSKKQKHYILEMFPYPSGLGLHMGHALMYTLGDIYSRFKKLQGFNVLHPMGYDALGLPAENAAIKDGTLPSKYTKKSIDNFTKLFKKFGISYDWTRTLSTSDPSYYKWDQWIFLKMLEKGLAYQKESSVNWCSKCETVLANEQVQNGMCWRHEETPVQVKKLKQWFLKITDYADELYEGLSDLKDWPERTKTMQRNWIGKSHGTQIMFEINKKEWPIFTTRPDTIFGVTFMVVSAQHTRLDSLVTPEQEMEVDKFLKKLKSVSEKDFGAMEKEGVFTGSYAINPANNEKVPVYAGNFVLADYGSGMVMAVPAHDKRDFEFAKKYKIKITQVVSGDSITKKAYVGEGKLINSEKFNDISNTQAKEKITSWLEKKKVAKKVINFKLRDWGISRQRYWGTPIPIIHCEKCGAVPVPQKDLPLKLPEKVKFGKGNPLETATEWIKTSCPRCKGNAKRETDTMDTFVNSSWYFLRYCDSSNDKAIFDKKKANYWTPVDYYFGGSEHACMHLIYSRFYSKFLRDIGLVNFDEPFTKLFHQGFVQGADGNKMSKSLGNVVDPYEIIDKFGVDTLRLFLFSVASPDKDYSWSENGIIGSFKFVKKIINYYSEVKISSSKKDIQEKFAQTVTLVEKNFEKIEYRKVTILLREFFEQFSKEKENSKEILEGFLILCSSFCPHITEELWEKLGNKDFISNAEWPKGKIVKQEISQNNPTSKIIEEIKSIQNKLNSSYEKIYVYVLPFELSSINQSKIKNTFKKDVTIFAVNDSKKYDPKNKAKNTRPGKPSIYVE
ncbi:leucine--tRNA ligase [archaeon]|jgi:leucyl-tRNA synthetase|nr:leucine--tRNA ligase [archaeon]MBT6182714.1 leucine--tRNA ligase [archaeon]MBT6606604.1 leucine--tRNA ligase [archaeon]MBT7251847.1 leucine--tRNA ligase [archaeon]MBT7661117.1 leucine--tRNA ligase [archaeon]